MPQEVLVNPVTSDDPEEKKSSKEKKLPQDVEVEELSKEDRELKERLELYVERLQDVNIELARTALNQLKDEIRTATASMTSVPKPLRFLREHYDNIKVFFESISDSTWRRDVADLMSILAMVFEEPKSRVCLKLRLESTPEIESWGAQYIKHLAAEIRIEIQERDALAADEDDEGLIQLIPMDQMYGIAGAVVEFYMKRNSEPEACDTLLEVDQLERIVDMCEEHNYKRVCEYLQSSAQYAPYPDDEAIYRVCHDLSRRFDNWYGAMRYALRLDSKELVVDIMAALKEKKLEKKQVAFLLGWHQYGYEEPSDDEEDDEMDDDDDDDEEMGVNEIISNAGLHDAFHDLARELDVLEPKDPEVDIFKEHLSDDASQIVSARKQLAATYVNSFVNAGFGRDKYMCSGEENATDIASQWIYRNKDHGMMAAVASVGMIMLWDEDAVNAVDRYVEAPDVNIRAGAFLAIGVACSGMRSDADLAYALLQSHAERENNETDQERVASAFGLGLAYAGQAKESIYEVLWPLIGTDDTTLELSCVSALSLGLVYVGTCNADISNLLLADLLERNAEDLDNPLLLLHVLGLGLLFLQRSEEVETTLTAVDAFEYINPKFARTVKTTLEVLAYAGTGNVLKVQQFMEIVGEHFDEEKKVEEEKKDDAANADALRNNPLLGGGGGGGAAGAGGANAAGGDSDAEEEKDVDDHRYFQSIATIGVAAVALGEELGVEMALRMFNHFIQYGNTRVKRAVPLALALLSISNPNITVADILSRLSHDHDDMIAQNAIFGLGLIGAGTNNARIATMLRQLTDYYAKDANHLFLVRVSQGLLFMGKGLLTVQPLHSDRFLLSKVAFGGILAALFASIDLKNTILGSRHYLLFSLVLAMKPRMLVTLDENLKQQKVTVRVGQALDVVGIAGKPKTITGFQTHESPVLLGYKDRAELANDEYIAVSSILEGFAILKKNPDFDEKKNRD